MRARLYTRKNGLFVTLTGGYTETLDAIQTDFLRVRGWFQLLTQKDKPTDVRNGGKRMDD